MCALALGIGWQVSVIEGLSQLRSLCTLCLDMNQIGAVNDGLVGCANLRELSLNNNRLTVLNGLSRCTGLQKLSVYRNAIEKIDGLQHLRRLHSLDLGRNQIRRAEGLDDCECLQTLILYENRLEALPARLSNCLLREAWFNGNQITALRWDMCELLRLLCPVGLAGTPLPL